jgi:hypothetical protein
MRAENRLGVERCRQTAGSSRLLTASAPGPHEAYVDPDHEDPGTRHARGPMPARALDMTFVQPEQVLAGRVIP